MISVQIDGIEYRFFDHLYAVSRCGKVLRKLLPYFPPIRKDGYATLGRQRLMHRIVAQCWIENPTNATHVHHINGKKSDNRVDNLEWVTPKVHLGQRHEGRFGHYKRTEETRRKMSEWRIGRKDAESTRLKKAAGLLVNGPKTPCRFQGVLYPSVSAGAYAAGINKSTFRVRCLSKNFPEYELGPFHDRITLEAS